MCRAAATAGVGLWLWPLAAMAQAAPGPEDARALFERGVAAADELRWADAADAFERSYALVPRPATLRNLGLADRALGRYTRAIGELERFLASRTASPAVARDVQRLVDEMRGRVGLVVVTTAPPDARAAVDGEPVAQGEMRLLDPGRHRAAATAAAHERAEVVFSLAPGERRNLDLRLTPLASAEAPRRDAPVAVTERGGVLTRWWFWTAVGAVVAGGVAASVILLSSDASPDCGSLGRCLTPR